MTLFKIASPDTRANLLREWILTYVRLRLEFYAKGRSWDGLANKQGVFALYASQFPTERRQFGDTARQLPEVRREKNMIDREKERARKRRGERENQTIAPDTLVNVDIGVRSQVVTATTADEPFNWHDYLVEEVLED